MGSACGCPSPSLPMTPRVAVPHSKRSQSLQSSHRKFHDIRPLEKENLDDSDVGLHLINNQLSGRIREFENHNGPVSGRFDHGSWQGESTNRPKVSFTSRFGKKEGYEAILTENSLSQKAISHENIKLNFGDSMLSQTEKSQTREEGRSCLLSQPSHILGDSIFSEKMIEKAEFYSRHNRIGKTELQQWKTQQRQSYQIQQNELLDILQKEKNEIIRLVIQSAFDYNKNNMVNLLSYCPNPSGLRIHFNGIKRLLPLESNFPQQPLLTSIVDGLRPLMQGSEISSMAYHLTGWFPEQLKMSQITSFSGIFERLSTNMEDGNTLVFFSRNFVDRKQNVLLTKIDLKLGLLSFNTCNCTFTVPNMFYEKEGYEYTMKIENFVEFFDTIYLNWNPAIYENTIDRELQFTQTQKQTKYCLVIPPSSQDIEIRVFIQKHQSMDGQDRPSNLIVKLFEYQNADLSDDSAAVRTIQVEDSIFSDVLIFESCKQKTQYILSIQSKAHKIAEDQCYTVSMLSFVEMYFNKVKQNILLKQITQQITMSPDNLGYGINSPYFDKNLQFFVCCQMNHELIVTVDAPDDLSYEICLIPNAEGHQVMTKIKLETIINHSNISGLKMGAGAMSIKTTQDKYLLVINAFCKFSGKISISLALNGKVYLVEPKLSMNIVGVKNKIQFQKGIKWLPTHSGPRKRLKSNCHNLFQSSRHFTEYFKNPVIDKQISKGRYQFFVKNQSFKDCFDAIELCDDKNLCDPPALSMSIFIISENKQEFKIILDDAFYVPFGIGFWTQQMDLQQGNYRFVCPKMDKTFSVGTFGMVKC